MITHFDELVERRSSGSAKWNYYPEDVLPMWVADMDFRTAPPIGRALRARAEHDVFGYAAPPPALAEALCARLERRFGWVVTPEQIVYYPGVVVGMNIAARAFSPGGSGMLIQPPVYPPILTAPEPCACTADLAQLVATTDGNTLRYEIDFDALEAAIGPQTTVMLLCNPHNPTGRAWSPAELARIGEICERHNLTIISDEIWSDLTLRGARHTPIASLSPELAARTVTLMAPSKTFNLPGLGFSFGVIADETMRERVKKAGAGLVPLSNVMGATAALAAYTEGDAWLEDLCAYLTANRDTLVDYLAENMPQLRTTVPEATYLAWIDCREAGIEGSPYTFFLEQAKVGLNDGAAFGPGGEGFVRMNMACPRDTLLEGLERMRRALATNRA
jgi:cystathionine beta-lyase